MPDIENLQRRSARRGSDLLKALRDKGVFQRHAQDGYVHAVRL